MSIEWRPDIRAVHEMRVVREENDASVKEGDTMIVTRTATGSAYHLTLADSAKAVCGAQVSRLEGRLTPNVSWSWFCRRCLWRWAEPQVFLLRDALSWEPGVKDPQPRTAVAGCQRSLARQGLWEGVSLTGRRDYVEPAGRPTGAARQLLEWFSAQEQGMRKNEPRVSDSEPLRVYLAGGKT